MATGKRKRVLVAPLDWGLGHASRCVPVIRELLRQKAEVILAASGRPYHFLKQEFPDLKIIEFPGYNIGYPKHRFLTLHFALRWPSIYKRIKQEKEELKKIVNENRIDIVISDNRLGCRTQKTYNVYITHQLKIKAPFAQNFITNFHERYYNKYNEIWVPDLAGKNNLSGELGHIDTNNPFIHYVGPLTRFHEAWPWDTRPTKWWLTVILSGPEPQRSIFEHKVLEACSRFTEEIRIIRGLPEGAEIPAHNLAHVKMVNHISDAEFRDTLLSSLHVLCRPGYSTLCDLSSLNINPIVVPTPGQTEQEYLAKHHEERKHLVVVQQSDLNLTDAIRRKSHLQQMPAIPQHSILAKKVKDLLEK
jgi:predicted glycosyltransferase